jgi:hypothetical protein
MADNTTLDPGTGGDVIATDDIAGVKYQRVKVTHGADGSATDVSTASPLPVSDAGGTLSVDDAGGSITVDGTVTANAGTGPFPVSDDGGSLTVDGTVTVQDGGGSLTVDNAALSVVGGGAEATALRVTVASDSTGVVSVDDNGGSLTVDNPALSVVGAGAEATAQRVTLSSETLAALESVTVVDGGASLTVDNGGTFQTQESGGALTALQLLDDTVFADDVAFTPGSSKVSAIGLVADETATDSVDEGDIGAPRMTLDRKQITTVAPSATTEGLDVFRTLDADETEEEVKSSPGKLYGWFIYNDAATEAYVKFYNANLATTVVGTTVPLMTVPIPAGAAANVEFTNGIRFSTALCIAATTGVADADTGAPAANQVIANVFFK